MCIKSMLTEALNNLRSAEKEVDKAQAELARKKIELTDEIRKERMRQGKTIRSFALDIGITSAFLCDLELGRRFPAERNLQKIIDGLTKNI